MRIVKKDFWLQTKSFSSMLVACWRFCDTFGANKDGYFTNEDLASQTRTMLIVFDVLHPGCTALVAYDNSSNHHAMANDALVASRINLKDGGKTAAKLRDGWFVDQHGALVKHPMTTADGKQKGVRRILEERGLLTPGMK